MIVCPCCGGTGRIEEKAPVPLPPMQFRIYDVVRRAKHGISGPRLIDAVYADRSDGGPEFAEQSVYVQIRNLNRRLAKVCLKVSANRRRENYRLVRT